MRVSSPLGRHLAAALAIVLLLCAVWNGEALAQNNTQDDTTGGQSRPVIGTITNVATAQWNFQGRAATTTSNEVSFDVTLPPPEIRAFRQASQGPTELSFREPFCSLGSGSGSGSSTQPPDIGDIVAAAQPLNFMVEPVAVLRAGQTLIFEIQALEANSDPDAIDQLEVEITTSTGDLETEIIFETGVNTGVFVGQMATVRMPPAVQDNDCRLSLNDGASITVSATIEGRSNVTVSTDVLVLVDPFGVVFDSETGDPVNGARVTLVDDVTGLPATVFAEDGVTPWPSSVISGDPITDGAGNVVEMGEGEFWFPLTFLGRYRLEIEPPVPYSAPSVVQPSQLAAITRPDGGSFVIREGSYGEVFVLDNPTPVQIDIPLDRSGPGLNITKTVSRNQVVPGDVVFYAITATHADAGRAKRNVTITDTPSRWLRLRPDTIRINGEEAAEDALPTERIGVSLAPQLSVDDGFRGTDVFRSDRDHTEPSDMAWR